ncbi:hypothetical protein ACFXAF_17185 [Kitasatospora sp. NPDC059463]
MEAARFGLEPGFAEAGRCVAGIAGVCLAVRTARAIEGGGWRALTAGWSAADAVGRAWLAATVREFAGEAAADGLDAALAAAPAAASPAVHPGALPAPRRSGAAGWCDAMLTAGFEDVLALVAPGAPGRTVDGPDWAAVEAIADTCHRVPYPQALPGLLRPWLLRRDLASSWGSTSEAGRSWCRTRDADSGVRAPATIRRIIATRA